MSGKKEIWDAYDSEFNRLGTTLTRGEDIPNGIYHLVCDVAVKHIDGTYLLMQRDRKKHLGGRWELTAGGSALVGEGASECALRELREETGIIGGELTELGRMVHEEHHSLYVEYLCVTACDKSSIRLQQGETIAYKWVDADLLREIKDNLASTRLLDFI